MVTTDGFIWAAISVLVVVFLASLLALIVVCRHRYCRPFDILSGQLKNNRPDVHLITNDAEADMELDDVRLHPNIEKILADEQWVDDATGLIPHCLSVLKKCHHLTERLVAMMMSRMLPRADPNMSEVIFIAKKVSPRVDDVVRAMYPPLDPRLLEARCTALILSVSHMALMICTLCQMRKCTWVDMALADMEENLQVLREAGMAVENAPANQKSDGSETVYTEYILNGNSASFKNIPPVINHC